VELLAKRQEQLSKVLISLDAFGIIEGAVKSDGIEF
jgi:hypothetical protein